MFVLLKDKNTIINLDTVHYIYIRPRHVKDEQTKLWVKRGGAICFQFADYPDSVDEIEYKSYDTEEEAVVALSELVDKLGVKNVLL